MTIAASDVLKENGVQATAQRLAVLRAVSAQPHITADGVVAIATDEIGTISSVAIATTPSAVMCDCADTARSTARRCAVACTPFSFSTSLAVMVTGATIAIVWTLSSTGLSTETKRFPYQQRVFQVTNPCLSKK